MGKSEEELREKFKKFIVEILGVKVLREYRGDSPDMIIEWSPDIVMGVELKTSAAMRDLEAALGQLFLAKLRWKLDQLWLVLDDLPTRGAKELIQLLWSHGIVISIFCDDSFIDIKPDILPQIISTRQDRKDESWRKAIQIDDEILGLLGEDTKRGLTIEQIASLDLRSVEEVSERLEVAKRFGGMSLLRRKIEIQGDKIFLRYQNN